MKTLVTLTATAAALTGSGFAGAQEISGNVTLTTDYVFRGVTQTDHNAAIQGGLDFELDGFYAGTWASNVDFGDGTTMELDAYAGFTSSAGGFDFDWGAIYYAYPGSPDDAGEQDFFEFYGGVSREFEGFGLSAKLSYSPDFYLETGQAWYAEIGAEVPLGDVFAVSAHAGASRFSDDPTADYEDYGVGVSAHFADLDWHLGWHFTEHHDGIGLSVSKSIGG